MNKQKFFNFDFNNKLYTNDFYVNKTNEEAFKVILNNKSNIYLSGPLKSGKSLLGNIWLKRFNAMKFSNNFEQIINSKRNILIDNFELHEEEKIFHIINHCNSHNLNILIISNYLINENNILLKDLNSRIKVFFQIKINQPDDDMLLNILTKLFTEKQFIINSHEIFKYILNRANRSYEEIHNIVNKLDNLSLEKKRQLTIPLIKEIL